MNSLLFNYKQTRTFFKDGVIWGKLVVRRADIIKGSQRFQWYPDFNYIGDIEEFGRGWSCGVRTEYLERHKKDCGPILWPDYNECKWRLVSWQLEGATRHVNTYGPSSVSFRDTGSLEANFSLNTYRG